MLAIGIFLGVLLSIFINAFVENGLGLVSTKEVFSTVLGAGIALLGTCLTLADLAKTRKTEAVDRDDALAISAFVKAQAAYNNLRNLQRLISVSYANCDAHQKENFGLWLSPPAHSRQPITLSPEERAVFLRLRKLDLFEFVSDLDHVHNSTAEAVNRFTELKIDFMQSVPAIKSSVGMVTELTPENRPTIEPKVVLLNNIARQLPERIDEDTQYVHRAVLALFDYTKSRGVLGADFRFTDRTAVT